MSHTAVSLEVRGLSRQYLGRGISGESDVTMMSAMKCHAAARRVSVVRLGLLACVLIVPVQAQSPSSKPSQAAPKAPARRWKAPRTPWGDPDLQGVWNNGTITPLERPNGSGKDILSDEETA